VVRSVQDAHVPLSSMGRTDLSAAFCAAVDHTLAVHGTDRTQSVAAFAAELGLVKLGDRYASGPGLQVTTLATTPMPPIPPVPREVASPPTSSMGAGNKAAASTGKPSSKRAWRMVGLLSIAMAIVGGWFGRQWTTAHHGTPAAAAAVQVLPLPSMTDTASPPAVLPPTRDARAAAEAGAPHATAPSAAPVPNTKGAIAELDDWNLARSENTREGYEAYLRRYRRGLHSQAARNAIAKVRQR
jgi:non-specific serine/threonine protein kinase